MSTSYAAVFFDGSSFQRVKPKISSPPSACHSDKGSPNTVTDTATATNGSTELKIAAFCPGSSFSAEKYRQ